MMINPLAFATPQQREQMAKMQLLTKNIRYALHTEDKRVEVTLTSDDRQAAELVPQIQEALVASISQTLYQMFAMEGERV